MAPNYNGIILQQKPNCPTRRQIYMVAGHLQESTEKILMELQRNKIAAIGTNNSSNPFTPSRKGFGILGKT